MFLFGAFKQTQFLSIGQVRYRIHIHSIDDDIDERYARKPFYLSAGQKRRVRDRLKTVDKVVETLLASNVEFDGIEMAKNWKKEDQMTPTEKYYVFAPRDPKSHMKPITQIPHFTKSPHPRGFPIGYKHLANKIP